MQALCEACARISPYLPCNFDEVACETVLPGLMPAGAWATFLDPLGGVCVGVMMKPNKLAIRAEHVLNIAVLRFACFFPRGVDDSYEEEVVVLEPLLNKWPHA